MLPKKLILPAALVCALLVIGGYFLFAGKEDEKIINRNLARLVELAEKEGGESALVLLGQSRDMMRYVAQEPRVEVGPPLPVIADRRELEGVIVQVRQTVHSLDIRILRKQLTIADDARTAQMEVEAEASASYAGESARDRRKFSVEWVKEEGDWLVKRVRLEGQPWRGGESIGF